MSHPAITRDVLLQLQLWKKSGLTHWASIEKLRLQTVPSGYTPHAWNGSKSCFACNKDFATPCLKTSWPARFAPQVLYTHIAHLCTV